MTTGRRVLWAFAAGSALLRLAMAASLGAGHDEAYHALMAHHLDWSYYDHPPMMAFIARIGMVVGRGLPPFVAVRLGFVTLFAGSTLLMARVAGRMYGDLAGLIAAVLLNGTVYYGWCASTFVLPDGPLLFFWLLTIDRLISALERPNRLGLWALVGIAWGGAMLSKYHAVFLPIGAVLYLAIDPRLRRVLASPGPYLAAVIGFTVFSPVIFWNRAHGWASFAFQAERAVGGPAFRLDSLLGAVAGQAGYLTPWIWFFLVVSLVKSVRSGAKSASDGRILSDRFLLCQAIPPLLAFFAVACRRPVLPHWSLIGLLPVFPLFGRDCLKMAGENWPHLRFRLATVSVVPVAIALLVVVHARTGWFQKGAHGGLGWVAPSQDPTVDMMGWDRVAEELRGRKLLARPGQFVFTSKWYYSGHLAFEMGDEARVLCYDPKGAHAFADWSDPRDAVGHDGLFLAFNRSPVEPDMYAPWFERIELADEFEVLRAGSPVRHVRVYRCYRQIRPFPERASAAAAAKVAASGATRDGPRR